MYLPRVLRYVLFLAVFLRSSSAATLSGSFTVDTTPGPLTRNGGHGGNCASVAGGLDHMYTEAIDMSQAAIDAMNNYGSNPTVRATLESYFGITVNNGAPADQGRFDFIKSVFQRIVDAAGAPLSPEPFFWCGDGLWVETERQYSEADGKDTGRTLLQTSNIKSLLWSPKMMVYQPLRTLCRDEPNKLGYMVRRGGLTQSTSGNSFIVLCDKTFDPNNAQSIRSLDSYRPPNQIPNTHSLQHLQSWGSTLLHELTHLYFDTITDQQVDYTSPNNGKHYTGVAYGIAKVVALGRQLDATGSQGGRAPFNADSYRYFALAMYLPQNDWSRAGPGRPVQTNNRRELGPNYDAADLGDVSPEGALEDPQPPLDLHFAVDRLPSLKKRTFLHRNRIAPEPIAVS